jgi:hypothetical protein
MADLGGFLFGNSAKTEKLDTKSPEVNKYLLNVLNNLDPELVASLQADPTFAAGSDWLQQVLGGDTDAIEAPIKNDFYKNILPSIYAQYGGANGLQSSDFMNAQAGAAGDYSNKLAATRWGAQNQAAQTAGKYGKFAGDQALGASAQGTQSTFGYQHTPANNGFVTSVASAAAGGAGRGFGNYAAEKVFG